MHDDRPASGSKRWPGKTRVAAEAGGPDKTRNAAWTRFDPQPKEKRACNNA
jgi:hypothetical protein